MKEGVRNKKRRPVGVSAGASCPALCRVGSDRPGPGVGANDVDIGHVVGKAIARRLQTRIIGGNKILDGDQVHTAVGRHLAGIPKVIGGEADSLQLVAHTGA